MVFIIVLPVPCFDWQCTTFGREDSSNNNNNSVGDVNCPPTPPCSSTAQPFWPTRPRMVPCQLQRTKLPWPVASSIHCYRKQAMSCCHHRHHPNTLIPFRTNMTREWMSWPMTMTWPHRQRRWRPPTMVLPMEAMIVAKVVPSDWPNHCACWRTGRVCCSAGTIHHRAITPRPTATASVTVPTVTTRVSTIAVSPTLSGDYTFLSILSLLLLLLNACSLIHSLFHAQLVHGQQRAIVHKNYR